MEISSIFSKAFKNINTKKVSQNSAEALQKTAVEAFSKSLNELSEYTVAELPNTIKSQEQAIAGLEQLSNYVKGMMK